MGEISRANEESTRIVSALLSFVAGYVDSFTFITLFGLFVANVTGSFVIAGAEIVKNDPSWIGKLLAIAAFFLAAFLTAAFIACARQRGWPALMWTIMLETFFSRRIRCACSPGRSVDGSERLARYRGRSARGDGDGLAERAGDLMPGVPQTNVMTGNLTELGVETTELVLAWYRCACEPGDAESRARLTGARKHLSLLSYVTIGFLIGSAAGPTAYIVWGLPGVIAPANAILGAGMTWSGSEPAVRDATGKQPPS